MGKMAGRPLLQNLVKEAMLTSSARVQVTEEARTQQDKTAAADEKCEKCGKEKDACMCSSKKASIGSPEAAAQVEKLAAACDYAARLIKEGATLSDHITPMPPGVSQATASTSLPDKKGQGVHVVPMHPATNGSAMENTLNHAPELHSHQMQTNYGKKTAAEVAADVALIRSKVAGVATEAKETAGLAEAKAGLEAAEKAHKSEPENKQASAAGVPDALVTWFLQQTKVAEDALLPAHITAGKAVPPGASAAGESGGAPAGGTPQGPRGLVGSNAEAAHYKKNQAYANRKVDLGKYFKEPAMSGEHDSVLRDAFSHTPAAGTKFASETAAAARRVLLSKLAEAANQDGANAPGAAQ